MKNEITILTLISKTASRDWTIKSHSVLDMVSVLVPGEQAGLSLAENIILRTDSRRRCWQRIERQERNLASTGRNDPSKYTFLKVKSWPVLIEERNENSKATATCSHYYYFFFPFFPSPSPPSPSLFPFFFSPSFSSLSLPFSFSFLFLEKEFCKEKYYKANFRTSGSTPTPSSAPSTFSLSCAARW